MTAPTKYAAAICTTALLAACGGAAGSSEGADGTSASSDALTASAADVTLIASNSGKCVEVPGSSTGNAVQLQQDACDGTAAQSFAETTNADGTVTFTNTHSGKCIDVRSDLATNGNAVQQYACNGSEAQKFKLTPVTGSSTLVEVKTTHGLCLDVTGISTADDAKMQEWGCTNGANQSFTLKPSTTSSTPAGKTLYLSKLGAKCNGSDDSAAFIAAVTGARNNAYTLIVDCAATLDIGLNVDRSVFIDNGTTVQFQGAGKVIINNIFEPAFVLANTSGVKLIDWNVEWKASLPVSLTTGSYSIGGVSKPVTGNGSGIFNDQILSGWLTKNRGIDFADGPHHGIWSNWQGSVNTGAIFYLVGSTSDVTLSGLKLYSANSSEPSQYVPFGFTFGKNFKSNQTVTLSTPADTAVDASKYFDCPRHITVENANFDGLIMGFQGNTIDSTFSGITVEHVSDLQDAEGNNVGGVGQNFPPPHLFYLNYSFDGDPALFNSGITIKNVNEVGPRMGKVRPGGGGYADSLKLGCNDCSVDGYTTNRKDGFMDALTSNGLTVSNVTATYDSSFVDEYENWPAWRFPGGGTNGSYKNITFSHISITDLAATTVGGPVGNNNGASNANIAFDDVVVTVQSWTKGSIVPTWTGITSGEVDFDLEKQGVTQTLK